MRSFLISILKFLTGPHGWSDRAVPMTYEALEFHLPRSQTTHTFSGEGLRNPLNRAVHSALHTERTARSDPPCGHVKNFGMKIRKDRTVAPTVRSL